MLKLPGPGRLICDGPAQTQSLALSSLIQITATKMRSIDVRIFLPSSIKILSPILIFVKRNSQELTLKSLILSVCNKMYYSIWSRSGTELSRPRRTWAGANQQDQQFHFLDNPHIFAYFRPHLIHLNDSHTPT